MRDTNDVVADFMAKYEQDQFPKVFRSNDGPELTDEFVDEQLQGFDNILEMDVFNTVINTV